MEKISMIGLDLAKRTIQVHAAGADGTVISRRKVSSGKLLQFLTNIEPCTVAMEACAGSHHWGREIAKLGHQVKLIAPVYVKPFVKRQKNDAADAEAICEAALRPAMRFVAVKSAAKQASATVFKVRDLLVRQKTQIINALRGHLAEFGLVAPSRACRHPDCCRRRSTRRIAGEARSPCLALISTLRSLVDKVRELDQEIARRARRDDVAKRLMTIPGVGPVIATALEALAPPAETFTRGRDFSAWMGLTPRQHSTGGKARLGKTSKMGPISLSDRRAAFPDAI
ncbi:IS110 family transposase (plasmid) [Sinorhizobium garamanticum]|uniref:IS110 family transposase n=1 Tax=Sinorhizobium garamanticum TaxID=680247 RepID=A0ABY8DL47_9HYPH|nr:IS110 family transposase [Sinorhizobium garamanticum]WEX91620.1 IS110 family transposase [Sinorhizobium garamanticum]